MWFVDRVCGIHQCRMHAEDVGDQKQRAMHAQWDQLLLTNGASW